MTHYFIAGGAGFIGSHLARQLLANSATDQVTIYDNFTSGKLWHLAEVQDSPRLHIIQADLGDLKRLTEAVKGVDIVYHFAANPDIAKAVTQPDIDFWQGTYLTQNLIEAMRVNDVKYLLYASGSGVYGDAGFLSVHEDYAPMLPISTYGASKLACEHLIAAYCHMFGMHAAAFRFANVVGPNQTHGVAYDFIRRLRENPHDLSILGDGRQSKSYIYVDDVLAAMRLIEQQGLQKFNYFNVATEDYLTVTEIADLVVEHLGLTSVNYHYQGGDRGWKGDVPIVRFNSDKIRARGWRNQWTSREAMQKSIAAMAGERVGVS